MHGITRRGEIHAPAAPVFVAQAELAARCFFAILFPVASLFGR